MVLFGGQGTASHDLYDLLHTDIEGDSYLSRASKILNIDLQQEISKISDPHYSQLFIGIYQLGLFSLLREILHSHEIGMAGYSLGGVTAFLSSIHANLEESINVLDYRTKIMTSIFNEQNEETYDLLSIKGRFEIVEIDSFCQKNQCAIAIINAQNHLLIGGKVSDLKTVLSHTDELHIDHSKFLSIHEPSHTFYYKIFSTQFSEFLKSKFMQSTLAYPIISAVKLKKIDNLLDEITFLGLELSSQLHWQKLCQLIPEYGYELIIDLGPGATLTAIFKESGAAYSQEIVTIADFKTLEGVKKHLLTVIS